MHLAWLLNFKEMYRYNSKDLRIWKNSENLEMIKFKADFVNLD